MGNQEMDRNEIVGSKGVELSEKEHKDYNYFDIASISKNCKNITLEYDLKKKKMKITGDNCGCNLNS